MKHTTQILLPVADEYNWETSETDASIRQRRTVGTEALVGHKESNAVGGNDIYLLLSVQFAGVGSDLTLSQLKAKIGHVLVKLRYEHPEIALTAVWEEGQASPLIQYRSPKSNEDALSWAHRLVNVRTGPETGLDIRSEIEVKRQQEGGRKNAKPVIIEIVAPVAGLDVSLGSVNVQFVFHSNHIYLDGISQRIMAGDIFRLLGEEISSAFATGGGLPDFEWGKEIQNLGAPVLSAWKKGIELSGPKFDEYVQQHWGNAIRGMENYGLNPRAGYGLPGVIFHTFTEAESASIYKAVKSKIGPSATPAHVGHAAVFLSLLKANPPSADIPDTQVYVSQSPVNGRRYLENPEQHAKTYYPVAQSTCPVLYENFKQFNVVNASKAMLDEYLVKATTIARDNYQMIGNATSLPIGISFHNYLLRLASSDNIPMTALTAPQFTSDGINETYIPRKIADKAGNTLFSIDAVHFCLNQYMPYMSIRLYSFRGRTEICLCYNEGQYTNEEASEFLQSVASFMLQFAQ